MMDIPNVAKQLQTVQVVGMAPPMPPMPPAPPAPTIMMPKPLSYQFRVVEYVDENNNVLKVELQVQESCHSQYGVVESSSGFLPVPRIQQQHP